MKKILTLLLLSLPLMALSLGETPPPVTIEGDQGGKVDDSPWNSTMLKDKVHVLFYVDPDEKDTNNALSEVLKAKAFDRTHYRSVAIINLDATWMPNFAIESKLKKKQEKFPDTVYVKDKEKILVKQWGIADDSSDILLFDKSGKLIYLFEGKLDESEITKVIQLIEINL